MANTMKSVMNGVLGVVGGVIGLVIVQQIITDNTGTDQAFTDGTLEATVLNYIVPLLALGLLASAVGMWKFG